MGNKATEIYKNYPELLNGHVQSELKDGGTFDFPGISYKFIEQSGAKVIIAGSGMMTGGRILKHAEHYLPMAATRLLIVGYQGEGTTGRELLEGKRKVVIEGREVVVAAIISETKAMSSHPDQGQLLTWLKHIRGVKKVFLIHGEDGPREILAKKISEDLGKNYENSCSHRKNHHPGRSASKRKNIPSLYGHEAVNKTGCFTDTNTLSQF